MVTFLKRSMWQRFFGKCATPEPDDAGCWSYSGDRVVIDLDRAQEITQPGGAIRLEGKGLPKRILVVMGDDGEYRSFLNKCLHAGRRLDPVPGTETIQCCSVGRATYDTSGEVVHGSVEGQLTLFQIERENHHLAITIT